ncbi:hypothetical protein D3C73_1274070 [compost metagenome]
MHLPVQAMGAAYEPRGHHGDPPVTDRDLEDVDAGKQLACQRRRKHRAKYNEQRGQRAAGRGSHPTGQPGKYCSSTPVRKAGDQHPVMDTMLLDRSSHGTHRVPVLDVQVQPGMGQGGNQLIKGWDRLHPADSGSSNLGGGQLGNLAH